MILCITPDHDVLRYPDSTPESKLQQLYDEDCVILRVETDRYGNPLVYDWIGATGELPPVGWTRIEFRDE